jgi:hypothetical protein
MFNLSFQSLFFDDGDETGVFLDRDCDWHAPVTHH